MIVAQQQQVSKNIVISAIQLHCIQYVYIIVSPLMISTYLHITGLGSVHGTFPTMSVHGNYVMCIMPSVAI